MHRPHDRRDTNLQLSTISRYRLETVLVDEIAQLVQVYRAGKGILVATGNDLHGGLFDAGNNQTAENALTLFKPYSRHFNQHYPLFDKHVGHV